MNKKQKKVLWRIIIAAALMIILNLLPVHGYIKLVLFLVPYFLIGYDILLNAAIGIKNAQPFDENFLMAVATIGAFALGDYTEGTAVMLFYQIGELFQNYAVVRSRKSIPALIDIRPDYANIEIENGQIIQVDPDEVDIGTVIVVRPGEKIPIDGIVLEGNSALDTSALTGESTPKDVTCCDEVLSGCINLSAVIKLRTTKMFANSTASKILDLVENASSKKAQSERFISRFARVYTPIVCLGAVLLALLPPIFGILISGTNGNWGMWLYRALTFLVISCPCALVISIPLSFFAGIGAASTAGILMKGSNHLEDLSKVKCIAFDKTGTLTRGVFEVADIHHNKQENETILEYAALTESYSLHPIAESLRKAYGKHLNTDRVSDVREISGFGITAKIDGKPVAVGNARLMEQLNIPYTPCSHTGTVVHIGINNEYAGHILICDIVKPDAAAAITALKKCGVQNTVMLTGDAKDIAEKIAQKLNIYTVYAQLLPNDKVEKVEQLLSNLNNDEKLAFVGDGINDAPVLTRAHIGIAMGALGSDAATEAADVVLMDDNPLKIATAIKIAKKCMRIVYQNIYLAIGIKLACLILGAVGITNMWIAIFADVGVMVLAVLNAARVLKGK